MSISNKHQRYSSHHHKMPNGSIKCNQNSNNNHNSASTSPFEQIENGSQEDIEMKKAMLEQETRHVVESFLKRSLSQNQKAQIRFLKPEGYHTLKNNGRLPYYQRQISKPEQGSFPLRDRIKHTRSSASSSSAGALPSRPSLGELSSFYKRKSEFASDTVDAAACSSENDVRKSEDREQITPDHIMYKLLGSENREEIKFQSSDSFQSGSEMVDENKFFRRKSFSKAVSRKSVLSYVDSHKKEFASTNAFLERRKISMSEEDLPKPTPSRTPEMSRKISVKQRITASSREVAVTSSKNEDDVTRTSIEKKTIIKERLKKMMSGPSNKKKLKYKRSITQRQLSKEEINQSEELYLNTKLSPRDSNESRTPSPTKLGATSPEPRGPSPSKNKPSSVFRSLSLKVRNSPKAQHRTLPNSSSFQNVDTISEDGVLERNKSGSLPSSVRLGVNLKTRRYSEDITSKNLVHPDNKHKRKYPLTKPYPTSQPPARPHHLDLNKKAKHKKLRKFFTWFRRRHSSESSSSSGSSRSHSLPSIPTAVEQEAGFRDGGVSGWKRYEYDENYDHHSSLTTLGEKQKFYQHRGSMSFSSGDLGDLNRPETAKVIEDIAEILQKLSQQYNRQIRSRSSTPGSRLVTPEASFSSQEAGKLNRYTRPSRSEPIPNSHKFQIPKVSFNNTKDIHGYTDDSKPALNAYYNLSGLKKSTQKKDGFSTKMPKSSPHRRHTTSDFNNHHKLKRSSPTLQIRGDHIPLPRRKVTAPERDQDVVDGGNDVRTDPVIESHRRRYRTQSEHGSDVDYPVGHPSTSSAPDPDPSPREQIDPDKLVELLVQVMCKRGDEIVTTVDGVPQGEELIETTIRNNIISYFADISMTTFSNFASRFCNNVRGLVETSPSRHPEIFPVVMMFTMTRIVVDIVGSDQTRSAVERVVDLSTRYVSDFVQDGGSSWRNVLAQLHDTELELEQGDSPKPGSTDDELD